MEMAEIPGGTEGQPHPVAPGVERKKIPEVGTQEFPACAIPLGFLQAEFTAVNFSGNGEQRKKSLSKHSLKEQENSRFKAIFSFLGGDRNSGKLKFFFTK